MKFSGILLLVAAAFLVFYAILIFDPTVSSGVDHVVNFQKLSWQQNLVIVGIGLGIIGTLLLIFGAKQTSEPHAASSTNAIIIVVLLVVIAAILLGIVYLAPQKQPEPGASRARNQHNITQQEARETAAKVDTSILYQSLRLYKLDHGRYPTESEGLSVLTVPPKPYINPLPVDPWGKPYIYANPGMHSEVEVFTAGPDGISRTTDDIGSWQQ